MGCVKRQRDQHCPFYFIVMAEYLHITVPQGINPEFLFDNWLLFDVMKANTSEACLEFYKYYTLKISLAGS